MCKTWSVGNAAPVLPSVATRAPSTSASASRCCHAASSRETRPIRMTGRVAWRSMVAACAIAPAEAAAVAGGMKRAGSRGGNGSATAASCIPASRFT
jgi:hypothetical protein